MNTAPPIKTLRQLLDYDPQSGWWTLTSNSNGRRKGTPVLGGYRQIMFRGWSYAEHELAWYFVHGVWPENGVKHINGVKDDNRIANLQEKTTRHNAELENPARRSTASGVKGVNWNSGKWQAKIMVEGKDFHLGRYTRLEDAAAVRLAAENYIWRGPYPKARSAAEVYTAALYRSKTFKNHE